MPTAPPTAHLAPWEDRARYSRWRGLRRTIVDSLIHPGAFYGGLEPNGPVWPAIVYDFLVAGLPMMVSAAVALAQSSDPADRCSKLLWFLGAPILNVATLLGTAAITHPFIRWFHREAGEFRVTVRALAYSSSPGILMVDPTLGAIAFLLWASVLEVLAIARMHRMSFGKAALIVFLPNLLLVVAVIALALLIVGPEHLLEMLHQAQQKMGAPR